MPTTRHAGLHHVRRQLVGARVQLRQFRRGADAATMRRQSRPEHVSDQTQFVLAADGARNGGLGTNVASRPDELRMSIADLILTQPTAQELVDQVPTGKPMIDHSAATAQGPCAERRGTERHELQRYRWLASATVLTPRGTLCT